MSKKALQTETHCTWVNDRLCETSQQLLLGANEILRRELEGVLHDQVHQTEPDLRKLSF